MLRLRLQLRLRLRLRLRLLRQQTERGNSRVSVIVQVKLRSTLLATRLTAAGGLAGGPSFVSSLGRPGLRRSDPDPSRLRLPFRAGGPAWWRAGDADLERLCICGRAEPWPRWLVRCAGSSLLCRLQSVVPAPRSLPSPVRERGAWRLFGSAPPLRLHSIHCPGILDMRGKCTVQ